MAGWKDAIVARFPGRQTRDLHFRNLKHDQKVVVCQEIAKLPIGVCVTLSHKVTIIGTKFEATFKRKGFLYNYMIRWLLERVTFACQTAAAPDEAKLRVIFSRRGGTDYQSMMAYMALMRDGREATRSVRSIDWKVLDINDIAVENHSKWAGLQIADCATSAFFSAVEPNHYGNYEPAYARTLRPNLVKRKGVILGCGLTPVPSMAACQADDRQYAFFDEHR